MSNSGKAGSGRGSNRRRSFRGGNAGHGGHHKKNDENTKHKWAPPRISQEVLPAFNCPYCGKPIRDVTSAIEDKETGVPIHFDCVTLRIGFGEKLEKGEAIVYIGGGRFGIVSFGSSKDSSSKQEGASESDNSRAARRGPTHETRDFKIKKIIEWEKKDNRAQWRSVISEHYSEVYQERNEKR